jgi:hypothetical protein
MSLSSIIKYDRLEKLQLEATHIAPGLTAFSSRDSVYKETGWDKLSSTRERKKLCLMYNMYHGHAPSYLCGNHSQYNFTFKVNFK